MGRRLRDGYVVRMARAPAIEEHPEGLLYEEEFVSLDEERDLLGVLEALDFRAVTMRGQTARRTVRMFGLDYDYENGALVPAEQLPQSLEWLRARSAPRVARPPADLVQVLVSRYPEGAGIGWPRGAPSCGPAGRPVSASAPSRMRL